MVLWRNLRVALGIRPLFRAAKVSNLRHRDGGNWELGSGNWDRSYYYDHKYTIHRFNPTGTWCRKGYQARPKPLIFRMFGYMQHKFKNWKTIVGGVFTYGFLKESSDLWKQFHELNGLIIFCLALGIASLGLMIGGLRSPIKK